MPTCQISFMCGCARRYKQLSHNLFATIAVPKAEELVATPDRHGSKQKAESILPGGYDTRQCTASPMQPIQAFPITIYYAFKQSETEGDSGTIFDRLGNIS